MADHAVPRVSRTRPAKVARNYRARHQEPTALPPRRPGCQYFVGDVSAGDPAECGDPVLPGKPWCRKHWDVVFVVRPRKPQATTDG